MTINSGRFRITLGAFAALGATFAGTSIFSTATADPVIRQIDDQRVSIVDYSGKPPFKRRVVRIDALRPAEFARFEESVAEVRVDRSRIGERVRVTDFRGKPPFRRSVVTINEANLVEFARFEETESVGERPRRRGPFGKSFPFKR